MCLEKQRFNIPRQEDKKSIFSLLDPVMVKCGRVKKTVAGLDGPCSKTAVPFPFICQSYNQTLLHVPEANEQRASSNTGSQAAGPCRKGTHSEWICVWRQKLDYLRVDDPHSSLQSALKRPFSSATSQHLSFHHQVLWSWHTHKEHNPISCRRDTWLIRLKCCITFYGMSLGLGLLVGEIKKPEDATLERNCD